MKFRISRTHIPMLGGLAVFLLLYVAASIQFPHFLSWRVFEDLLTDNAYLGLAAIGMTFVILSGGIDLSVGAVVGFTTVLIGVLVGKHVDPWVAMPIALAVGTVFGGLMGWVISAFDLPPFLVTLAGMFLARGMAYVVSLQAIDIKAPFYDAMASRSYVTALIFVAALVVAIYVLHFRAFGRSIYAIGGNEQSALLMGLPVAHMKVAIYAVSGFCAALAGIVHTIYAPSGDPNAAIGLELDAIAAVVIGGTLLTGGVGYVAGTFVGVLILGIIQTVINFQGTLNSWWTRIAVGVLLMMFILLQKVVQVRAPRAASESG
jgi:simple sugar transport system permease protein